MARQMKFVDADGFLRGRIEEWEASHRTANQELFSLAETLNRECHCFLERHPFGTFESRQLTTMVLFVRLIELFQGVVLQVSRGLRAPSRILFRAFLEAYFHFEAIHNDPSYLLEYLNQFELERKKLIRRIHRTTDDALEGLRRPIDAALMADIESIKIPNITVEEVATRAGRHSMYVTAYAILSKSVHSSAGDIEDHLALDDESKAIVGVRYGPSELETVRTLGLAGLTLAEVLEQMGKDLDDDVSSVTKALNASFATFLKVKHLVDPR
jgi:hypothetical protein